MNDSLRITNLLTPLLRNQPQWPTQHKTNIRVGHLNIIILFWIWPLALHVRETLG